MQEAVGTAHASARGFGAQDDLLAIARRALAEYSFAPDSDVTLLDLSENATFKVVDAQSGEPAILRVHRLGYHTADGVLSELAWLQALRQDAGVRTPGVLLSRTGSPLVTVRPPVTVQPPRATAESTSAIAESTGEAAARMCVAFEFLPGAQPTQDHLLENFETLGEITARMHRHARTWRRPARFTRFAWTHDTAFGSAPRWGDWRAGPGAGPAEIEILGRLETELARRLHAYGDGPERFGLVHADLRLANLLADDAGQVGVIDFDDCGFSWYLYDLGTALSFIEDQPQVPELIDRWLRGYRKIAPLSQADQDEIWTFILYRRLLLTAWIGSHSTVEFARQLGAEYTSGACTLAERFLSQNG